MIKTTQIIRSYTDANKLIAKGYEMLKIDRDKNNRTYLIFIFKNSDELQDDLRKITVENKSRQSTY
ncbi:MAG: hypothetical protein E7211_00620 [Clostridium lundense]|nr:hypothetical protein [Clostridium lundense]